MILNLITVVAFAAGEININIIYPTVAGQQKTSYAPGDAVIIRGSSPEKVDLVLRVINNAGRIMHTDTILAPSNNGTYEFTFTQPSGLAAGNYEYNVAVGNQTYNATAILKVNVPSPPVVPSPSGDGGPASSAPPPPAPVNNIQWVDPDNKLAEYLSGSKDIGEAIQRINDISGKLEQEQKKDPELLEKVATILEETTGNLGAQTGNSVNNTLNLTNMTFDSQRISEIDKTMNAIKEAIARNNFELNRELEKRLIIKIAFDNTQRSTITIDPSIIQALSNIDILTIEDDEFQVSFYVNDLKEQLADNEKLEVYIERAVETLVNAKGPLFASSNLAMEYLPTSSKATQTAYKVSFNKDKLKNNVEISLSSNSKENTQYQAVIKIDGSKEEVVGGKYNSLSGLYDIPIQNAGTYVVRENRVDFTDIANKDAAMQEAIRVLASKGIIDGVGGSKFSPDGNITRAEVAKLLVKTLYAQRSGQPFSDIKDGDWYKTYAESARAAGIIKGLPDNKFGGNQAILKDQITAIAARTLVEKKKYKVPQNVESYLQFADRREIASWALTDVALASREGLIVKRTDSRFSGGSGLSRGEVALILKKLFDRL